MRNNITASMDNRDRLNCAINVQKKTQFFMNDEWRCPTSSLKDWICLYLNVKYLSLADGDASWYTKNASTATANTQCDTFSDCRWDERVAGNRQSGGDDQRSELSYWAQVIISVIFFILLTNLLGRFDLGWWRNSAVTQISLDANLSRGSTHLQSDWYELISWWSN